MDPLAHTFTPCLGFLESLRCRGTILETPAFEPMLNTADSNELNPGILDALFALVKSLADPGTRQMGASRIAFTIKGRPMVLELSTMAYNMGRGLITPDTIPCWIIYTNSRGYKDMIPAVGRHKVQEQLEFFLKT